MRACWQAGDCVVAFSRRDIFDIKTEIERLTTMRCCVVYGALPPETRRMQVSGCHFEPRAKITV